MFPAPQGQARCLRPEADHPPRRVKCGAIFQARGLLVTCPRRRAHRSRRPWPRRPGSGFRFTSAVREASRGPKVFAHRARHGLMSAGLVADSGWCSLEGDRARKTAAIAPPKDSRARRRVSARILAFVTVHIGSSRCGWRPPHYALPVVVPAPGHGPGSRRRNRQSPLTMSDRMRFRGCCRRAGSHGAPAVPPQGWPAPR